VVGWGVDQWVERRTEERGHQSGEKKEKGARVRRVGAFSGFIADGLLSDKLPERARARKIYIFAQ